MKRLFAYADEYVKQSDWKDMALLKFCLCAAGILIGVALPAKAKKTAVFAAIAVFIATYLPLMSKFLRIILAGEKAR